MRWLIHKGDFNQALDLASAALAPVARLADKELEDRFNLLAAEACARNGRWHQASLYFRAACFSSPKPTVPFLVELFRVAAVVISRGDHREAQRQLNCALRLASSAGLLGAKPELDQTGRVLGIELGSSTEQPISGAETLTRLRVILALGGHPALLGKEILELIRGIGGVGSARVLKEMSGHTTLVGSLGVGGA